MNLCLQVLLFRVPVFLKVGGIAPLGSILHGKGAKKQRGR